MPSSVTFTSSEPYEFEASVRAGQAQVAITARGAYRAAAQRITLHNLWMQRIGQSLPHVARVRADKSRSPVMFLPDFGHPPIYYSGKAVSPGDLVILSSGAEFYQRAPAACYQATMAMTPEALAEVGRVLVGYDLRAPPVTRIVRPPPREMSRLMSLHRAASDLVAAAPETLEHPEVAKAIEQSLVHAMVRCLTSDAETIEPRSSGHTSATVMRRLEDLLEEKAGEPLYVAECCAQLGVTDRTLREYCQQHVGMGAHRYLWLRRMHLARRLLVQADRKTGSVTTIANDCGFGELGRFAVKYHQLFGEPPSATLNRPSGTGWSSDGFFHQWLAATA